MSDRTGGRRGARVLALAALVVLGGCLGAVDDGSDGDGSATAGGDDGTTDGEPPRTGTGTPTATATTAGDGSPAVDWELDAGWTDDGRRYVAVRHAGGDAVAVDRLTIAVGHAEVPASAVVDAARLAEGDRIRLTADVEGVSESDLVGGRELTVAWRSPAGDEESLHVGPVPRPATYTRRITSEQLDATLVVSGTVGAVEGIELEDGERAIFDSGLLERVRVSAYVHPGREPGTGDRITDVTVKLGYDPARIPEGSNESDLAVFAYNETLQTFVPLNSTVYPGNDTVVGTEVANVTATVDPGGENRVVRPSIDDLPERTVFVVLDAKTWYEWWEERGARATPGPG